MIKKIFFPSLLMTIMVWSSCSSKSEYERLVEEGIASGERYDSLFLGISLGMTDSAFYTHCWELNKQKKIYQGGGNTSVAYKLKDELKHAATMEFYPEFVDRHIAKIPVVIKYDGWAPWNDDMAKEELQLDVLKLLEKWYGKGFMEISHPELGKAYINVRGNRRISLYAKGESEVIAFFTDLSVKKDTDSPEVQN